jgi:hypothetical protein
MATITYNWSTSVATFFVNNVSTAGDQAAPAIASNGSGDRYFAAWDNPGANLNVDGRLINANGAPVADEFLVNSTTALDQSDSSVAGLTNGNYVVSYTDTSTDPGGDIRFRLFNASGAPIGADVVVSGDRLDDKRSDVTALAGGGFAIAWDRDFGGNDFDIRAWVFDANGSAISGLITVEASGFLNTNSPSITGLVGGGFVVAWTQSALAGGDTSIVMQRYSSTGEPLGASIEVDKVGSINTDVQVQALADGGFVVAYTDNGWGIDGTEITAKVFNADGKSRTDFIRANTDTTGVQDKPTLTALTNGFFVVGWSNGNVLLQQAFDALGNPAGTNFTAAGSVIEGEIAALSGGLVANVRASTIPDRSGNSIRSSVSELTRTTAGDGTNEVLTGDSLRDVILGGGGNDFISGGAGADTLDGGADFDAVSWFSETAGVLVNLKNQALNDFGAKGDSISNFEA